MDHETLIKVGGFGGTSWYSSTTYIIWSKIRFSRMIMIVNLVLGGIHDFS